MIFDRSFFYAHWTIVVLTRNKSYPKHPSWLEFHQRNIHPHWANFVHLKQRFTHHVVPDASCELGAPNYLDPNQSNLLKLAGFCFSKWSITVTPSDCCACSVLTNEDSTYAHTIGSYRGQELVPLANDKQSKTMAFFNLCKNTIEFLYHVESRWRNYHVPVYHGPLLIHVLGSCAIYSHYGVYVYHDHGSWLISINHMHVRLFTSQWLDTEDIWRNVDKLTNPVPNQETAMTSVTLCYKHEVFKRLNKKKPKKLDQKSFTIFICRLFWLLESTLDREGHL